jgi:hypothetical protein
LKTSVNEELANTVSSPAQVVDEVVAVAMTEEEHPVIATNQTPRAIAMIRATGNSFHPTRLQYTTVKVYYVQILQHFARVFQFSVLPLMRGSLKGLRPFGENLQPPSPAQGEKGARGMRAAARVGSKDF